MMKPVENVIKHLETLIEMNNQLKWHFGTKSKLWNETINYIAKNKDNVFCPHPKNYSVPCHRGTGYGITIQDFGIWGQEYDEQNKKFLPRDVFWIKLEIEFYNEEENHQIIKRKEITFPIDLEENFSQEKFQKWIEIKENQNKKENSKKELELLQELLKKYPES